MNKTRRIRRSRGVALVELALILPVMLVMTFIVTEYGRAIYQYNTLTKSVRDAARYLSFQTPETHRAQARNLLVYGNLGGTGTPLALGLTAANVPDANIFWATTTPPDPVMATVTVRITGYQFRSIFPTAFGLPFGTITFSNIEATMRSHL
ncbi:MAG TPA: TadE family protein [Ramlibacter sp.]|nr:TadE family protein [Ramlibacter sp.]